MGNNICLLRGGGGGGTQSRLGVPPSRKLESDLFTNGVHLSTLELPERIHKVFCIAALWQ